MYPMMVFLHPKLPSSVAYVMQLSCISVVWAFTRFCNEQGVRSFPTCTRFLVAHLHRDNHGISLWTGISGLLSFEDYPPTPSLNRACKFLCTRLKAVLTDNWRLSALVLADRRILVLSVVSGGVGAPYFSPLLNKEK